VTKYQNLLAIVILLVIPNQLLAEATCSSSVYYTVTEKEGSETKSLYTKVFAKAENSKDATTSAETKVNIKKAEALNFCRVNFENQSKCLEQKLANLHNLHFQARAILIESDKESGQAKKCASSADKISCVEIEEKDPDKKKEKKKARRKAQRKKRTGKMRRKNSLICHPWLER